MMNLPARLVYFFGYINPAKVTGNKILKRYHFNKLDKPASLVFLPCAWNRRSAIDSTSPVGLIYTGSDSRKINFEIVQSVFGFS